jgi:RNA-directed DNA polymerase
MALDREPNSPREWEIWLTATRKAMTRNNLVAHRADGTDATCLVHSSCYRHNSDTGRAPVHLHLNRPLGLTRKTV